MAANPNTEEQATETTALLNRKSTQARYSVFTTTQKRILISTASLASTLSPLSANIYYPVLNSMAKDLHVSHAMMNFTIMGYMLLQAFAPTIAGSIADVVGRRPVYIFCFLIYIASDVALALQRTFPALVILRAVQSSGSSPMVALASAVAADIVTSAERGMYLGIASLGSALAPSLGPIIGGILSHWFGWPSIFWFLAIVATLFFVPFLLFFPETCRTIVKDGSVQPLGFNQTLYQWMKQSPKQCSEGEEPERDLTYSGKAGISLPDPLVTLRVVFQFPTGIVMLGNGILFASYYAVMSSVPSQFEILYGFNDLQIGLAFIPAGLGTLFSAFTNGVIVDWNYRRVEAALEKRDDNEQNAKENFPFEKTRLQIALPMMVLAAMSISIYGWVIFFRNPIWAPMVLLFLIAFSVTGAYNVMNILVVDLNYSKPATAMAANNLVRCTLGAAATVLIHPLLDWVGRGWSFTCVAGAIIAATPLLLVSYRWGLAWRASSKE
ncbi:hypothetical protein COCMIDRAFT_40972 [Bipolaris oryzae ATCC 44560]|uniref:Major facilitator superfamily (MFS) profile domain-containing protein n=1 Tax=Bipolaris oryzae ATCC 44560 TaxID=930090 RepID=W6YT89_COCMI|nr:uncharacterized protein COCMIDRAFT_40972 [Bipolaris oryzae ATCC 44560]EUC40738.1 hypothetical protein COCMIDRAFT_40972 [Bipolaris oryzae ATCC 44560]